MGCGDDRPDTGVELLIESPGDLLPDALELVWLGPDRELLRRRVPGHGALRSPGRVSVRIDMGAPAAGARTAVVRGHRDGVLVSEGVGSVIAEAKLWRRTVITMRPGPLVDSDGDGIPDEAGFCPRERAPCRPAVPPDGGAPPPDGGAPIDDAAPVDDSRAQPATDRSVDSDRLPPSDGALPEVAGGPEDAGAPNPDSALDVTPADIAPRDTTPPMDMRPPPDVIAWAPGLLGTYFRDLDLQQPVLTRVDSTIDFDWSDFAPHSSVPSDFFTVRWTGQIQARFSEMYTFTVIVNDGARLWIDDKLVIDGWDDVSMASEFAGQTALVAGRRHAIKLEYMDDTGDAEVRLLWSSPSQLRQVVPASQFSH